MMGIVVRQLVRFNDNVIIMLNPDCKMINDNLRMIAIKNIQVSIIIPSYNQAPYIEEALESVLAQTFPHWEALVIDDGSTDETEKTVLPYTLRDKRIRYVKKENGGVASARNHGINLAQGEWIVPLDADDRMHESFLERTMERMLLYPDTTIVCTGVNYFGLKMGIMPIHYQDYRTQLFQNQMVCTTLFRKADALSIGGYDEAMYVGLEDWEFYIRLLYKDKRVETIKDVLFDYRIKDVSRNRCCEDARKMKEIHRYIYMKHIDKYLEYFESPIDMLLRLEVVRRKREKHYNRFYRKWFYKFVKRKRTVAGGEK